MEKSEAQSRMPKWLSCLLCSLRRLAGLKLPLRSFFEGGLYPLIVAALVAIGHITGAEFYLNIVILLMAGLALVVCESTLSLIVPMVTFIFQVPLKHSPGYPTFSTYYFDGVKIAVVIILALFIFGLLIYRFARLARRKLTASSAMLIPVSILSVAFLLNGAFSAKWGAAGLLLGFIEAAVYFIGFYLFYLGLSEEGTDRLLDYICHATLCIALVLIAQMAFMYLTYDNLIVGGTVVKEQVNLGWGIWNPVGFSLTVLIPVLVYGAMRMKHPAIYIAVSILTYLCALLTMSRNALIFATLALAVSFIIGCFAGNRRKLFRIITAIGLAAVAIVAILLREKVAELFSKVLEQGLSDNGRFSLWSVGIENFLSSPIFGTGLFSFSGNGSSDVASFIPTMAHNTFVQLLSSMGIVGLIAYGIYRAHSLVPFVRRPSLAKSMLLLPILIVLGMSLLDNFVFYVYTIFYYNIVLAIAFIIYERERSSADVEEAKLTSEDEA